MTRLDNLKVGAKVRHVMEHDLEGKVTEIIGDWIFVQVAGENEPRKSLWGFWEIVEAPAEPVIGRMVPRWA